MSQDHLRDIDRDVNGDCPPTEIDAAYDLFINEHEARARTYCKTRVREDEEDVFQEACLALWTARHHVLLLNAEDQKRWFWGVLRKKVVDRWRKKQPESNRSPDRPDAEVFPDGKAEPPEIVDAINQEELLRECLALLDEEDRFSVVARFHEQLPDKEIATTLGVSVQAVRTRRHRALIKLKTSIEEKRDCRGQ